MKRPEPSERFTARLTKEEHKAQAILAIMDKEGVYVWAAAAKDTKAGRRSLFTRACDAGYSVANTVLVA